MGKSVLFVSIYLPVEWELEVEIKILLSNGNIY